MKKLLIIGLFMGLLLSIYTIRHRDAEAESPRVIPSYLELVNAERAKVGKPPLIEDPKLNAAAQAKAKDMSDRNYYLHHLPGEDTFKFVRAEYPGRRLQGAENIGKCRFDREVFMKDWVNSPPHHEAILSDTTYYGWGEFYDEAEHCKYAVNYFLK